jgi:hypothetical protein
MDLKRTLADDTARRSVVARILAVTAGAQRRWGKMTAHQMLCHMTDSYRSVTGEREVSPAPPSIVMRIMPRRLLMWLVLDAPMKWPRNVRTRPENEQGLGGTPPGDFEADRRNLLAALERFCVATDSVRGPHPMLGKLSRQEWLKWGYLHADHHLRQFGL